MNSNFLSLENTTLTYHKTTIFYLLKNRGYNWQALKY